MFSSLTTRLVALVCASGLAVVAVAGADVLIVDCQAGPFFDIAPAVEVAQTGDTVLVHECAERAYGRFRVESKIDVHVVAAIGELPLVRGEGIEQFCIEVDGDSERVSIQGLAVRDCISSLIQVNEATETAIVGNDLEGEIVCIGDRGEGTQIVGNVARQCTTAIGPSGEGAWIARNRAFDGNISISGTNNTVVENLVTGARFEGLTVFTGSGHRAERNRVVENQRSGLGTAEIVIHAGAVDARVIANFVDGGVIFDTGQNTEVVGNQ